MCVACTFFPAFRTINLKAGDLREAIAEPLKVIVSVRHVGRTPPNWQLTLPIAASCWLVAVRWFAASAI